MKSSLSSELDQKEKISPKTGVLQMVSGWIGQIEANLIDIRDSFNSLKPVAWTASRFRAAALIALHLAAHAGWWMSGQTDRLRQKYPALDNYQARLRRKALRGVESAARAYSTISWARVTVFTALLVTVIATVDSMLGHLVSFRLLYVLPIWLAARLGGAGAGLFGMILVGSLLTFTDYQVFPGQEEFTPMNFAVRWAGLGTFLLIVLHVEGAFKIARQQATHDPLTGLANRESILAVAQTTIEACRNRTNCLHVAIADCDLFKTLNDQNGHAFGDHALKVLARRLVAGTRDIGAVGRIGGDEFVVLFYDVERGQAEAAMEKVNLTFKRVMASLGASTSISFGVATLGADGHDFDALCRVADDRMYARKRTRQAAVWMAEGALERRAS